ncbi:MAG: FecR family protein [Gemmataceae bacterium]|nr:FecR family protein [Gemmataceae bacterium]
MERAHELIQKYLDEIATDAELAELERLLVTNPDVAAAFATVSRLDASLAKTYREEGDIASTRAIFAMAKPAHSPRRFLRPRSWQGLAAAAIVLAVGSGIYFQFGRRGTIPELVSGQVRVNGVETARVIDGATVEVVGPQPAVIALSDGSRTELSPASSAVFVGRLGDVRQVVQLLHGVGRFEVQKGGGQFRVDTAAGTVTALGTQFAVKMQPFERVQDRKLRPKPHTIMTVIVTEGSVQVDSGGQSTVLVASENRNFTVERKADITGTIESIGKDVGDARTIAIVSVGQKQTFRFNDETKIEKFQGRGPQVGQNVAVWLDPEAKDMAYFMQNLTPAK